MKTKYYVKNQADVPTDQHWAILTFTSVHIPGDERSRTNPGHGYPASTERYVEYTAFTNEEEWEAEIKLLEERHVRTSYSAMRVTPAASATSTWTAWWASRI